MPRVRRCRRSDGSKPGAALRGGPSSGWGRLITRRAIEGRDAVRNLLGNMLQGWHGAFDSIPRTVADAVQLAENNEELRTALEPIGEDRGRLNSRRIGNFLSRHEGRIERSYRLEQAGTRRGVTL